MSSSEIQCDGSITHQDYGKAWSIDPVALLLKNEERQVTSDNKFYSVVQ